MKSIKSFISILFFICAAATVSAKPSNSRGRQALCNPDKIVVSCDIDTSNAMRGTCLDGEYYARVYLQSRSSICSIMLNTGDFEADYSLHYDGGAVSDELCEKLDVFTYRYSAYQYFAPLIITIKNAHIVEIRSDDVAWDKFARWVGKAFYGIDGYALIN